MIESSEILDSIPDGLRRPLLSSFRAIAQNYVERRWEPSELNGGKFSEAAFSIISGVISGRLPDKPSKPQNMVKACRDLELAPADSKRIGDRSIRILIPRVLQALYEIRSNRGVGHIGGDVDPNFLDATAVYGMASWVLAEMIRIFHALPTEEAQAIVDELVERKHPLIWEIDGISRILDPEMSKADQTLLLLYVKPSWVMDKKLLESVEYSSLGMYRRRVLIPFHEARLIEYDRKEWRARISPLGAARVEQSILRTPNRISV